MALTRSDETDLLTVLHEGIHEDPAWSTFLARLQRRTRADHVSLIVGEGNVPISDAMRWFAGHDLRAEADRLRDLAMLDLAPDHRLRPGRVYAATEYIDPLNVEHSRFRREHLDRVGVRYGRFMRVVTPERHGAWLSIIRASDDFSASDAALLASLAPHLSIVLRTLALLETTRIHAAIADDTLRRAGIGWMAIDAQAAIVARGGRGVAGTSAGSGIAEPTPAERALALLAESRGRAAALPVALRVDSDVPVDVLVVPLAEEPRATSTTPTLVALSRVSRAPDGQADALAVLFNLSASEARLAMCLARGQSLTQSAEVLKLTPETVRNYSKRLYAKTGTRGQADLVRLVLTSVASLA